MTSGSFTIGPTSGDYASLSAAVAAISGALTGSLTFTVIEDYTETAAVSLTGVDLNGQTLTITGDTAHNGNPDSGRIISYAVASLFNTNDPTNSAAGSQFIISNLNLRCTATQCETAVNLSVTASANDITAFIYDVIVDYRTAATAAKDGMFFNFSGSHTFNAFNCLVLELDSSLAKGSFATDNSPASPNGTIENCVALNGEGNAYGFNLPTFTGTVRNCAAINCAGGDFNSTSTATGYSNMSTDSTVDDTNWATASGNIKDIVATDEFDSVVPTDPDFMYPSSSGVANRSGTAVTITGNNHSVTTSVPRPQMTQYAIGWQEYAGAPIFTTQPISDMVTPPATINFTVATVFASSYQWQEKTSGASTWTNITGETTVSYTTPATTVNDHYTRVRCEATGYLSQIANSTVAVILIDGELVLGEAPDRPTASIGSIDDNVITIDVSGNGDIYRAEILDLDNNVVAYSERTGSGQFSITVPRRGIQYALVVTAGNAASPAVWSLPGLSLSVVIPPLAVTTEAEPGVGFSAEPSSAVREAGPLGAGLAFPFRFSETTGAPTVNQGADHIVDGMQQILLTRIGERPIRREFGSPIAGKLFTPDVEIGPDISAGIQMALTNFEHRAEVTQVVFKRDRIRGQLSADIHYRIFRTHKQGNLVYPFSMEA